MVVGDRETEAKWQADGREHERVRAALRRAGASRLGIVRESNLLLDTIAEALQVKGHVLRLRHLDDGRSVLTFKGTATYRNGIKTRAETELDIADRDAMLRILTGLGFRVTLEYEKTRESWEWNGAVVALDTLDFGSFVEIEGAEEQIRSTAALLALDLANAERHGYPSLMRKHQAGGRAD